jgi:hypothetical protein
MMGGVPTKESVLGTAKASPNFALVAIIRFEGDIAWLRW